MIRTTKYSSVLLGLAISLLAVGCDQGTPTEPGRTSKLPGVVQLYSGTLTVTKTADAADGTCDADCSLREAITAANTMLGPDNIVVPAGTYGLTIGELDITDDLTILGAIQGSTIIDAGAQHRVFAVEVRVNVEMDRLTIRNGNDPEEGGGILNEGQLTIRNSTITNNTAGVTGGGIFNNGGTLTIVNSTIQGNTAEQGGGVFEDGGDHTNTFTNTTFAGNTATGLGGGAIRFDSCDDVFINSTISGNFAVSGAGGGMFSSSCVQIRMQNTILGGNSAPVGPDCSLRLGGLSLGNNVVGDPNACNIPLLASDLTGDPGLDVFMDDGTAGNGHFPLLATSPAIDVGNDDACLLTDQIGQSRIDGNGDGKVVCDIGAIEFVGLQVDLDIKPGSDPNSINCNNPKEVITVAIVTTDDFDATTVDHTTVTFVGASETHVEKKTGETRRHEEDVDYDGDIDLVFHFRNGDTSLTCNSTAGTLTGETFDGLPIEGTDAVRMIGEGDCLPPPSGLVSWWPGDGSAKDIQDANDGTLVNGATFGPGIVGQAFSLDGVDDFVRVPDAANLDVANEMTIDAWVKPTERRLGTIIDKAGPNSGYTMFHRGDMGGGVIQGWIGTGVAYPSAFSNTAIPLDQFSHVAVTYDGSMIKVYINGVLDGGTSATGSIVANTVQLNIGTNLGGAFHYFFKGLIDEVEIFNRALTAEEIRDIYEAGSDGKCKQ